MGRPMRSTRHALILLAGAAAAALMAAPARAIPVPSASPPQVAGGGAPTITPGSNSLTVGINAARTIIDWQSFNIGSGESVTFNFGQSSWIALNRVASGTININGALNALRGTQTGGNIWLYSPQGVVFGSGASVNVGGLLATSAAPDPTDFLNPSNLDFHFTGSGSGGPVTIGGGAHLNGIGYLAFVAPQVTSGSGANIQAGDVGTVDYSAVDSYEIKFIPSGQDLTFFTFIVPSVSAGTSVGASALDLRGTTTGANVYLMALARSTVTGALINAPGLLVGQSSFANYGQVTITTGRSIVNGQVGISDESQQVTGVTTGSATIGQINAGGNVNIWLTGTGSLGDLNATSIRAGQQLSIGAHDVKISGAAGLSAGDALVNSQTMLIEASGAVSASAVTAVGNLFIGRNAAQTGRDTSQPTITLGPTSSQSQIRVFGATIDARSFTAPQITLATTGTTNVNTITATGDSTATQASLAVEAPLFLINQINATTDADIRIADMRLGGGITARNLTIEGLNGLFRLGGTANPGLTDAELQKITLTGSLNLYAGTTSPGFNHATPVDDDFTVLDFTLDPTKIPQLHIFADNDHQVLVTGAIKVLASGGGLRIGDSGENSPWAPGKIVVTGTIGEAKGDALAGFTDVKAFDTLEFYAKHDVLIGSQRFVDLVKDATIPQIDIAHGLPVGVAAQGDEIGKLFLVAGSLTAVAGDRIVQQNTGTLTAQSGFYLTGQKVKATDPLLTIGKAQLADLFGALQTGDTVLTSGSSATFSTRISRLAGDASLGTIRINGCQLLLGCTLSNPATQFRIESFHPAAPHGSIDPPVLTAPPPVSDDAREAEAVITGTGNEEIWRRDK